MALCEKYKREIAVGNRVCPDPDLYCNFRGACLIYSIREEEGQKKDKVEEKVVYA